MNGNQLPDAFHGVAVSAHHLKQRPRLTKNIVFATAYFSEWTWNPAEENKTFGGLHSYGCLRYSISISGAIFALCSLLVLARIPTEEETMRASACTERRASNLDGGRVLCTP